MAHPVARLTGLTVDIAIRRGRAAVAVRALDGVDLTVSAGAVTAVVGESGCGKSLVAAALCGLLPPGSAVRGRVTVGGTEYGGADDRAWRRVRGTRIGYVPQSAATSFTPVRTIGAQLAEVCRQVRADRSPADLLRAAHLPPDALDLYPHELSGGMAQRAAIAAAIAGRPALLVADEPTSALEPRHAALVWELLGRAAADGAGVLVVTHDLPALLAAGGCADIAVMRAGRVVAQAPLDDLLGRGDEYVERLFGCVVR